MCPAAVSSGFKRLIQWWMRGFGGQAVNERKQAKTSDIGRNVVWSASGFKRFRMGTWLLPRLLSDMPSRAATRLLAAQADTLPSILAAIDAAGPAAYSKEDHWAWYGKACLPAQHPGDDVFVRKPHSSAEPSKL